MIFLCVLLLRNEVYVFQSDWLHVHINFPLAHHRLHLEISIVVVKRQTMFRTELHQCFDTFSRTLFVGDRDRIDDILLRTWLTMPAWAVAGTDSVLITRKADQLAEPCDLRAVSAVECPIPPTCPECQPWLRECHMEVFLIMPTTPEGKAKLSKELAKFHAEQALKMVQKLPCPTEQKLELIDAVVEHLRSKQ